MQRIKRVVRKTYIVTYVDLFEYPILHGEYLETPLRYFYACFIYFMSLFSSILRDNSLRNNNQIMYSM